MEYRIEKTQEGRFAVRRTVIGGPFGDGPHIETALTAPTEAAAQAWIDIENRRHEATRAANLLKWKQRFEYKLDQELERLGLLGWTREGLAEVLGYSARQMRNWRRIEPPHALQVGVLAVLHSLRAPNA